MTHRFDRKPLSLTNHLKKNMSLMSYFPLQWHLATFPFSCFSWLWHQTSMYSFRRLEYSGFQRINQAFTLPVGLASLHIYRIHCFGRHIILDPVAHEWFKSHALCFNAVWLAGAVDQSCRAVSAEIVTLLWSPSIWTDQLFCEPLMNNCRSMPKRGQFHTTHFTILCYWIMICIVIIT